MLTKEELITIRRGFSHLHLNAVTRDNALEIGYFEIVCYQLETIVEQTITRIEHSKAYQWLIKVIFIAPKQVVFVTAREAYVHVISALDALTAIAEDVILPSEPVVPLSHLQQIEHAAKHEALGWIELNEDPVPITKAGFVRFIFRLANGVSIIVTIFVIGYGAKMALEFFHGGPLIPH